MLLGPLLLATVLVPPSAAAPQGASPDAPTLLLETPSGERSELPLAGLELSDPRGRGAWICRPQGVAPLDAPPAAEREAWRAVQVELTGGDILKGDLLGGGGEDLRLRLSAGLALTLNVARVRALRFPGRIPGGRAIALDPPAVGDRLDRWTGREVDSMTGALDSFRDEGVRFESEELGLQTVPWEEVAALFLEDLGGGETRESGALPPVVLDLADGSRLRAALVGLGEQGAALSLAGTSLLVPWGAIDSLLVSDGQVRYLSDVEPLREQGRGSPFGDEMGMVWQARMDACVTGGPLLVGRRVHRRGIGMHAPSRLTFALDGSYRALRGACAIDESSLRNPAPARGSVRFRVLLDGEVAFESAVLRGGDPPARFAGIDLAGHEELALEVDPVGDFQGDRADWLDLLLTR